jgi:hypothetical protein
MKTNPKGTSVQVHRFGDAVAVSIGTGETVYLTMQQARMIGKEISACAEDVNIYEFCLSPYKTFHLDWATNEESDRSYCLNCGMDGDA